MPTAPALLRLLQALPKRADMLTLSPSAWSMRRVQHGFGQFRPRPRQAARVVVFAKWRLLGFGLCCRRCEPMRTKHSPKVHRFAEVLQVAASKLQYAATVLGKSPMSDAVPSSALLLDGVRRTWCRRALAV